MPAPKGNRFWEQRSSHGRNPKFASPEDLWNACTEYFEWVEDNPLYEEKVIAFQGIPTHVPVAKMRAMTKGGMCIFLGITQETWDSYARKEDFLSVTSSAMGIIREQKFTGAAADLLNANIIARDLGLTDNQAVKHSDDPENPIGVSALDKLKGAINAKAETIKPDNETNEG